MSVSLRHCAAGALALQIVTDNPSLLRGANHAEPNCLVDDPDGVAVCS
jgi:hypothetical protein